jgi:hypothetical protein
MMLRRGVSVTRYNMKVLVQGHRMDILGIDIGVNSLHGCWNLYSEHSEHQEEAFPALLHEGATQAPAITRNGRMGSREGEKPPEITVIHSVANTVRERRRLHGLGTWRGRRKPHW